MINFCNDCGDPFETDQKWKHLCSKCWLKHKHPALYEKRYLMKEITCDRCGMVFWDEGWKTRCSTCWRDAREELQREDVEEREQYK